MKRIALLCGAVAVIWTIGSVRAEAPSWRGQQNTTFQMWSFADNTNPSAPESYSNPGIPELTVMGSFPFTAWVVEDNGHTGVWKFEDWIEVAIPNYEVANPAKEIWVQLTYTGDNIAQGLPLTIQSVPTATGVVGELIDQQAVDGLYWTETYRLLIEPNPNSETIYIQPRNCTMFIDELVIDTLCHAPEPTTVCLLGLGALALLRKRRFV